MPCPFWGSCSGVLGVCMFSLQNLRKVRIVGLYQRPLAELTDIGDHPEGDHGSRDGYVLQNTDGEVQMARRKVRLDEQKHIPAAREDHPHAHHHDAALVALDIAREEQRERDEPMENEIKGEDHAPVAADAVKVPRDLLRRVTRPDDQELREV